MQETYNYDGKITDALIAMGLENLDDFRMAFDTAKEAADKVLQGIEVPNPVLQASRLKQAWTAVCSAQEQHVAVKKRGPEAVDLEAMLDAQVLNDLRDKFYARYHLRFAPEQEPSDYLISKVANQLTHRLLQVYPIWKVRSLTHQVMSDTKRRKVGNGLEVITDHPEETSKESRTPQNYLRLLHILFLAYARVGCKALTNLPSHEGTHVPEKRP